MTTFLEQEDPAVATRIKTLTLVVLALCSLAVTALNWPGHLSYDSVIQLLDGRTGRYHVWHPPFMAWLLGLTDHFIRGAGLYVGLQTAIFFAGLGCLVIGARRINRLSPLFAALVTASPLICVWQGIAWKDVIFADGMVFGFAMLFLAAGSLSLRRFAWQSLAAFVLLTVATLVRQNGAIALIVGAGAFAYLLYRRGQGFFRRRLARAAAIAAGVLLACLGVTVAINLTLATRAVDAGAGEAQVHMLQTYDVLGALAHQPSLELDDLSPPLAQLMRDTAKTKYTSKRNDALLGTAFDHTTAENADDIQEQWFSILLHHPWPWLQHRAEVFGWHIGSRPGVCLAETTGVDGRLSDLRALGLTIHQSPRDLALEEYAETFHDTPIYSHIFYAIIAVLLLIPCFRSRDTPEHALGLMLVGALLFTASFALIGVACDYRYLYALDLCTMSASFYWLLRMDFRAILARLQPSSRGVTAPVR